MSCRSFIDTLASCAHTPHGSPPASTLSATTIMIAAVAAFALLAALSPARAAILHPLIVQSSGAWAGADDVKVPVVLGVMSACPDAIVCESVFDRVLERVADKIDLRLTFIGK